MNAAQVATRALTHLLRNAGEVTPPGGEVILRIADANQGRLRFSVSDMGPGLPDQSGDSCASRFHQAELERLEEKVSQV